MLNKNKSIDTYDIFDFPKLFTKWLTEMPFDTFVGKDRESIDWIIQNRLNNNGFLVQTQDEYSIDEYTITPVVGFPSKIYLVSGFSSTKKIIYDADIKTEDFMLFSGYERNFIIMKDIINQQLRSMYTIFDKDFKLEEKFKGLNLKSLPSNSIDNLNIEDKELKNEVSLIRIQYGMLDKICYMMGDIFDAYNVQIYEIPIDLTIENGQSIKSIHQFVLGDLIAIAAIYSYLLLVHTIAESDDNPRINTIHHILQTQEYIYNQNRPINGIKDFSPVLKLIKFISTELTYDNRSATVKLCLLEDYIKNNLNGRINK